MKEQLNSFYVSLYESLKDIADVNNKLDNTRSEIRSHIDSFKNAIEGININIKNPDIEESFKELMNSLKEVFLMWNHNFSKMLEREKFRTELKNKFIVIIFGKVKAGKSTFGNFIANNKLEQQKVEFLEYRHKKWHKIERLEELPDTKENGESEESGFATDVVECTDRIQRFNLGGMAWIDTPGLGSLTKENGALAREYIENADYIIYPTSSTSPLQKDEQDNIKELFDQNKKVTICITKSDIIESDECECDSKTACDKCEESIIKKLVNKNDKDRKNQEEYVKNTINEIIPKEKIKNKLGDIFSISVATAKEAIKNNDLEMFENSNIPKFYELMKDHAIKKAKSLKSQVPYDGLNAFISLILSDSTDSKGSIKDIYNKIEKLENSLNEGLRQLKDAQKISQVDLQVAIDKAFNRHIDSTTKENVKEKCKIITNEINSKTSEIITNNTNEILQNISNDFGVLFEGLEVGDIEIEDIFIETKHKEEPWYKKAFKGGAKVAGSILAILPNPFVKIIGGGLAAFGDKVADIINDDEIVKKTLIGDNKEVVLRGFRAKVESFYSQAFEATFLQLGESFSDIKTEIGAIKTEIGKFKNNMEKVRRTL
ncbi:hypothetical protein CCY99_03550 [Helicobacter sp. 16-1353]|uniref:dynamin family protein n=1 Tax=Helicobacter sp. 16-1353 TaxID=2004996 RepID=UPI000DCDBA5E|nr:dynamin family protein [Helicobacter sp. 16-1353]RAX54435.1 hypothetical protein CCY99_03550 [Helicobacter sp. 16-1353]